MALGKNVLIGQSGGPTAVINASLAGAIKAARDAGCGVLGMVNGVAGLAAGTVCDLDREVPNDLALELLRRTPGSYLGSCRYKLPDPDDAPQEFDALFQRLCELQVGVVAYIGGNDSMDTIAKLGRAGEQRGSQVRFVGVPKTIDNDLACMDHTPGYGSAAKLVATCTAELARDCTVYPVKSVLVVETMGRDVGWLGAAASLACGQGSDGPDLVLIPEAPVDVRRFLDRVADLLGEKDTVLVSASEGVRGLDGRPLCDEDTVLDAFGHAASQSGVGGLLARRVREELGVKARGVELSTVQRCAAHLVSGTDAQEAERLGVESVRAALEGATRQVSCLTRVSDDPYAVAYGMADVDAVANAVRPVPASMIAADGMGVTEAFRRYAAPLVLGDRPLFTVNGLPWHLRLGHGVANQL